MPGMENDPGQEWQRLQEVYSQMSEDELQAVATDSYGLTDMARQVLTAEIKTRRLDIHLQETAPESEEEVAAEEETSDEQKFDPTNFELVTACTCWDQEEARTAKGILDDAGIPSYFGPQNLESIDDYKGSYEGGVKLRVLPDHQQWALATLAKRWPKDPNAQPEPELPDAEIRCPKCHSDEVVLDAADSTDEIDDDAEVFRWHCDACGHKWQDDGVEKTV
jgi:DNA-directed RNA polymerase subunit M/transcription elongation factor TFIIS